MHAAIKGTSAGGKSEIRKRVLEFFPPEHIIEFTSLSEKALVFCEEGFELKILSMGEAVGADEQSMQDYFLRELMSNKRIVYKYPVKGEDGQITTITVDKDGPVSFMVTTTKNTLHPENETRMLSLEINDSDTQRTTTLIAGARR